MDEKYLSCEHCTYQNPELCKQNGFVNEHGICKNFRPDDEFINKVKDDVNNIDNLPPKQREQYRKCLDIVEGLMNTLFVKDK